jgi:hypothetical protein
VTIKIAVNSFTLEDGSVYNAREREKYNSCQGCAFRDVNCTDFPACHEDMRSDKRDVIFIEEGKQ